LLRNFKVFFQKTFVEILLLGKIMIHYLKGKIEFKGEKFLVIEVAGVGYKVFCSPNTLKKISMSKEIKLFTFLYLREETAELYGFLTQDELELFKTLNEISGIGPKTALELSSFGSLENLKKEMEKEEFHQKIKGIGKKKMQKILLELTGKIKEISKKGEEIRDEALDVLVSLGFPGQKAKEVLSRVSREVEDTEGRVKEALKILGK